MKIHTDDRHPAEAGQDGEAERGAVGLVQETLCGQRAGQDQHSLSGNGRTADGCTNAGIVSTEEQGGKKNRQAAAEVTPKS